jgi:transposase
MTQVRKKYTKEFKLEALKLVETSGKPIAVIERELGLSSGCIRNWQERLTRKGKNAFPGNGRLAEDEARIRQLERELAILRQERDILKKAIAVLSPKPN